jgi:hypothetical protein
MQVRSARHQATQANHMKLAAKFLGITFCVLSPALHSAEPSHWLVLNIHAGTCEPLSEVHAKYPYLSGANDPFEIRARLSKRFPDAKLENAIDFFGISAQDVGRMKPKQAAKLRAFTHTNSYVVTADSDSIGIPLATDSMCRQLGSLN